MFVSMRSLVVGVVIGVALAAAAGIAYASIPDSSGVIHACWQNVTSANKPVKLLNTSQKTTCPSGWSALSWNQTGAQGPPGGLAASDVSYIWSPAGYVQAPGISYAYCPSGSTAVGGGFDLLSNSSINTSAAYSDPTKTGWYASPSSGSARAFVVCVTTS